MTVLSVGDNMVDSNLFDLDEVKHSLSDYNDKYILMSFWSMTCLVCMKAAKDIKIIHEKYADKLNVIAVNMDTSKSMWEQGTRRDNISWINLSDGAGFSGGVGLQYGITGYPAYVLINTDGKIVDRWMGYKPGRFEEKLALHLA